MPRRARVVLPGVPVHIVQRGNYRQTVFFSDADRICYLTLLATHAESEGLELLGWCLMSNHTHLIAIPHGTHSLARAVGRTYGEYSRLIHGERARTGHLWQARFYSAPLSETFLWTALRYVELNPVRAGMVADAAHWPWSSAAARLGCAPVPPFLSLDRWREWYEADSWRERLEGGLAAQDLDLIRVRTKTELPCGDEAFVSELERRTGRRLRALPVRRPCWGATRIAGSRRQPQSAGR